MSSSRTHGSRPRRVVGAVVVVGLLVAALVSVISVPSSTVDPSAGPPTAATPGPPSPQTPSPSPGPTTPTGPPGPGVTEPGILITAALVGQDSFTVSEQVRVSDPVSTLTLRPIDLTRLSSDFADETATATGVQLIAGGQPLVVPDGQVTSEVQLTLPAAVETYTLTYSLRGTVVRTVPSTAGRGLGAVGPLSVGLGDDLPVVVQANGRAVLNLYCPTRPNIDDQDCASGASPRLRTDGSLPAKDGLVVLQLNLMAGR